MDMGQERKSNDDICGIVSSFASRPDASVEQIVDLFARLRTTDVSSPAQGPVSGPARPDTPDQVTCLVCGKGFKMLKRHIRTAHGLSEMEYRVRFGLGEEQPLVAPDYSRHKADQARASGLGRRLPDGDV
jgi:predicted transcriptional regulator